LGQGKGLVQNDEDFGKAMRLDQKRLEQGIGSAKYGAGEINAEFEFD
jgi:hypothetical protein